MVTEEQLEQFWSSKTEISSIQGHFAKSSGKRDRTDWSTELKESDVAPTCKQKYTGVFLTVVLPDRKTENS